MNRTKLAELVTILAGMATVFSGVWSFYGPKAPTQLEASGFHSVIADELAGKVELTDEQIDALAALKIKSVQDLRPLVHQLCADVRQLNSLRTSANYDFPALRTLEQRVLKDKALIMEKKLEDHQTANHILGS
jgi:hypothetical protein